MFKCTKLKLVDIPANKSTELQKLVKHNFIIAVNKFPIKVLDNRI